MTTLTRLKHSVLGYWPVLAHAANIVAHWQSVRERVKHELGKNPRPMQWVGAEPLSEDKAREIAEKMGDPDFFLVDSHIEELAHALYLQGFKDIRTAGRRAGQWPGVPPVEEKP